MGPVDVVHIVKYICNFKRGDTHRLTEGILIEVFKLLYFIFRCFGGGASPLIATERMLCESLTPHIILNISFGFLVKMTSKIEGGAFLVKQVGLDIRLL